MRITSKLPLFTALVIAAISLSNKGANAQDASLITLADSLNGKIETVRTDLDVVKRLKITGYIQAQWQKADTAGSVTPFSGGAFPTAADNRFMVRRGRVKFTYDNELTQYVLQLDATEKGVALKDAYVAIKEPWLQVLTLTAGVFNRPFGYEITYSSSNRETPERARIFQTLFPQERDLGAMITLSPKKGTKYDWIKLDAGFFTGNGINPGFNSKKDYIAHGYFSKSNKKETIKYGGGISAYNGNVFLGNKFVYYPGKVLDVTQPGLVDSTASNKNGFVRRTYVGVDGQLGFQSPAGFTQVRAEYIFGNQPASKSSSVSLSTGTAPTTDTYLRQFAGGYVYFIQSIGQSKHQLVVKYDWYDPNTKVKGTDVMAKSAAGKNTALGAADLKFTTIGLGWNYRFNSQVKFSVYYEIVKNENSALSTTGTNGTTNTTKDLKDNVLTLRAQYKF